MLIFMIILLNHYVPHFVQLKAGAADKYDCKTSEEPSIQLAGMIKLSSKNKY